MRDLLPHDPRIAGIALAREGFSTPLVAWVRSGLWWTGWLLLPLALAANWEDLLWSAPATRTMEESVLDLVLRTIPLVCSYFAKSLLTWVAWSTLPFTGWIFVTVGLAIWLDLQDPSNGN
jgi:hypothetical protein